MGKRFHPTDQIMTSLMLTDAIGQIIQLYMYLDEVGVSTLSLDNLRLSTSDPKVIYRLQRLIGLFLILGKFATHSTESLHHKDWSDQTSSQAPFA